MDSDLEQILLAANKAPSGENCQPWHFVVHPNKVIDLKVLPERDQSYYSWGQRASYLAVGAALENLAIAASALGYKSEVSYSSINDNDRIATVSLVKSASVQADPLVKAIDSRVTNRNSYSKESLSSQERDALISVVGGSLVFIEDSKSIETLGKVGALNEEIMLGNHELHDFFFSHISWTKEEDQQKKVGFYIETLELPPPAKAMFKLFRNWGTMRFFNALGFNKVVGKQNAATYASASAIGVYAIDSKDPLDFLKAGRTIERLWLTATSLGLDLQPMTGVLYFKLKIAGGEGDVFTKAEREQIEAGYNEIVKLTNTTGKTLAFMFRIGHGKPASAQAVRFPLAEAVSIAQ